MRRNANAVCAKTSCRSCSGSLLERLAALPTVFFARRHPFHRFCVNVMTPFSFLSLSIFVPFFSLSVCVCVRKIRSAPTVDRHHTSHPSNPSIVLFACVKSDSVEKTHSNICHTTQKKQGTLHVRFLFPFPQPFHPPCPCFHTHSLFLSLCSFNYFS